MIVWHLSILIKYLDLQMAQFPFKYNVFEHLQFEPASDAINYLQALKGFSLSIIVLPVFGCEQQLY